MPTASIPTQDRRQLSNSPSAPAPDIWRALLIEAIRREGGWRRQEEAIQQPTDGGTKPFANIARWQDRVSDPAAVKLRYTKGTRSVIVPPQMSWHEVRTLFAETGVSLRRVEALLNELLAESRGMIDANPQRPVVGTRPEGRSTVAESASSPSNRAVPIAAKSTRRTRGKSSSTARRRKRSASEVADASPAPDKGFRVPSNKFGSVGVVGTRSLGDHQPTPEQVKIRKREDRKKKRKSTTLGMSARGRSVVGKSRRRGLRSNGPVRVVRRVISGTHRAGGFASRVSAGATQDAVDTCAHEESHAAKGSYWRCPECSHRVRANECAHCGENVEFKIETDLTSHHPLPCRAPIKRPLIK